MLAQITIKFKASVICGKCGKQRHSSVSNTISVDGNYDCLSSALEHARLEACNAFIQPPYNWAVYGRTEYRCPNCKE